MAFCNFQLLFPTEETFMYVGVVNEPIAGNSLLTSLHTVYKTTFIALPCYSHNFMINFIIISIDRALNNLKRVRMGLGILT